VGRTWKLLVFNFLTGLSKSAWAKTFHTFMLTLILLNVAAVMLATVPILHSTYIRVFSWFEIFSVAIFTLEYLLRLWVCPLDNRYSKPFLGQIRFLFTPMALIDLLAILPFYLPLVLSIDMRFVRIIWLFRIFRIFKLGRYSDAYRLIARVFINKIEYLGISLVFVASLLVVSSSLMFFAENSAQPEVFSSIPAAMWWAIITLTTVGYGDIYPVTLCGKLLSGVLAILGIGLFALPAGILATGFSEELSKRNARECLVCPHCGKMIAK
jgi:voltage-gated potassium channel